MMCVCTRRPARRDDPQRGLSGAASGQFGSNSRGDAAFGSSGRTPRGFRTPNHHTTPTHSHAHTHTHNHLVGSTSRGDAAFPLWVASAGRTPRTRRTTTPHTHTISTNWFESRPHAAPPPLLRPRFGSCRCPPDAQWTTHNGNAVSPRGSSLRARRRVAVVGCHYEPDAAWASTLQTTTRLTHTHTHTHTPYPLVGSTSRGDAAWPLWVIATGVVGYHYEPDAAWASTLQTTHYIR
jgi:hypothetical protein